jgi:hypothetical protein
MVAIICLHANTFSNHFHCFFFIWIDANTSWGANRAVNFANTSWGAKKEGERAIIVANVGIK